ncbi:hypothetical protein [Paenibacillus arenilitoris]|uniref:DUF2157 domain-containing protein n=1 Tax=Paenibacillus arenilitoris TaxID=2772299 RepID=A0A927CPV4_9BACL|nr:hypothetical protein [Paenibacillus arenilitoris]MBD2869500.1 hypothetical protein [Paenibacillus arenilitoris]
MNQDRRQIIVKEIDHWRRSKLLPDQYCDFLLNLYADQETSAQIRGSHHGTVGKAVAAVQRATGMQWLLTFGTFTFISFVVLYFNEFHPLMQMGIVAGSTVVLLWIGQRLRSRSEAAGLTLTGLGMLLLLGGGLYMLDLHGMEHWGWRPGLLAGCSLMWVIYGIKGRIPVLHACGWLAAILVYASLLARFTSDSSWYEIQLYWLPVACLFGWGSWFVHRWSKPVSAVFFFVCAIVWFMPELYAMMFAEEALLLQAQLIAKIAAGGGVLFLMRKQWMVWVA